jgi:DNA repair protein RadD
MKVREYQSEALEAIWNDLMIADTSLCVLPTGSGKTFIFSQLLLKAIEVKPDIKCTILLGRVELVSQTERALSRVIPLKHISVFCGSLNRKETARNIIIASIQSVDIKRFPPSNLLIIDEAHRLDQEGGSYSKFIEAQKTLNPKLKIVGFTATAFRANGVIYGHDCLFKKVTYRKTIKELIALGFLCEPKMKGSAHSFDVSQLRVRAGEYRQEDVDALVSNADIVQDQIKDALSRMPDRKTVVWACANIEHCNLVANHLHAIGESVTTVHSKLGRPTRDANLSAFMGGSCRHMVFVTILSEGFDHPPIDCVVLMRPTRSPVLYVQTVGRGLRLWPEKTDCLVLDYGQVIKTLGPLDEPNVKGKRTSGDGEAPVKECPVCFTYVFAGVRTCPECSHEFPAPKPVVEKLDKKADSETKILSEAPKPQEIFANYAFVSMYEAKSGNLCVKVLYTNHDFVNAWGQRFGESEYFVTTSPWAMERLERRLTDLDIELPGIPFEGERRASGGFNIVKMKEGKYDRIVSVKRVPLKAAEKQEDPDSFNFGHNAPGGWDGIFEEPKPNSPEDIGF